MKKTLLFLAVLSFSVHAFAQNSGDLVNSPAVQETQNVITEFVDYPEDLLIKSMNESLAKQGKALGAINDDGSIYVVGSATTARPSNMPGFVNSRNAAYGMAELTAKMNLMRLAGEQITSGRGFNLIEDIVQGQDPDGSAAAAEVQKKDANGKTPNYKQDYNESIRSVVASMVKGCAVVRIAEGECGRDDYQISVCIKYSPEFQSFASQIMNGGGDAAMFGKAKNSREEIMTMSSEDLVRRLGVWVSYNPDGEMVVYGFGQQEVLEKGSRQSAAFTRAYSQARMQAINNIKKFAAEDLIAKEVLENTEKLREYADGTNAYFSQTKWQQSVESKMSELHVAAPPVRQWKGFHPETGTPIAGFVVSWTYTNALKAAALKQQLNDPSSSAASRSTAPRQQTQKGVIVITNYDDDL